MSRTADRFARAEHLRGVRDGRPRPGVAIASLASLILMLVREWGKERTSPLTASDASATLAWASSPPLLTASATQQPRRSSSRASGQGRGGRRDLREDVYSVGVLVDHAFQTAHLSLDAAQAAQDHDVLDSAGVMWSGGRGTGRSGLVARSCR